MDLIVWAMALATFYVCEYKIWENWETTNEKI